MDSRRALRSISAEISLYSRILNRMNVIEGLKRRDIMGVNSL
jgi:hypothetical protein